MSEKKRNEDAARSAPVPSLVGKADGSDLPPWNFADLPEVDAVAAWEWDLGTETVRFSSGWQQILRSDQCVMPGPMDAGEWRECVHHEDLPKLLDAARAVRMGQSERFAATCRVRRNDGSGWAWVTGRGRVYAAPDGKSRVARGFLMDISPLRNDPSFQMGGVGLGDATYHAMLENSPDLYVRMDHELFPLYVNPVVCRYVGKSRDELTYMADLAIDPELIRFLQRNIDKVFSWGVAVREATSFRTPLGEEVSGEYSFWPEFDALGVVRYAMTHFRDLTKQSKDERRARLNERRLQALYRLTQMDDAPEDEVLAFVMDCLLELTSSAGGFIFFPDDRPEGKGRMIWSRDHYERGLGAELTTDAMPRDLVALTAGADGEPTFRAVRNSEGAAPLLQAFGGRMAMHRVIILPVMEEGRIVCVAGVCNKESDYEDADVRQLATFINGAWLVLRRRGFMLELKTAKEAAEHANRVKGEFLANVSHELRTPLNGILSMLQLLEMQPLSPLQRDYVRTAGMSSEALLRIISDILDFSRMESGKVELRLEPVNIKSTVRSSLGAFQREAERRGIGFSLSIDEDIPDRLIADDARLRQIIFNLVGNAQKFTERGAIAVELSRLSGAPDRERLCFSVRDTGIGIPKEQQESIFEAFTQVDNSNTRRYAGTGLGLTIAKRLANMMGGDIELESETGVGTTVRSVLHFAKPLTLTNEGLTLKLAGPGNTNRPMDILVAEDDTVGRFAIKAFLTRAGHRALCVNNGRQALEALRLYRFHCLFTDIQMPDMDGLEVVERIRSNRVEDIAPTDEVRAMLAEHGMTAETRLLSVDPRMSIVAVSAHAMAGDRERFIKTGMNYYISKPIIMTELAQVLAQINALRGIANFRGE